MPVSLPRAFHSQRTSPFAAMRSSLVKAEVLDLARQPTTPVSELQQVLGNQALQRIIRVSGERTADGCKECGLPGLASAASPARIGSLPKRLKAGVEMLSGLAMDSVKVHYNSPEPARVHALAYTQGTDIHVAPGQEPHLPHEAWHVVQQHQGRVRPTMQLAGTAINNDSSLEWEADTMGAIANDGGDNSGRQVLAWQHAGQLSRQAGSVEPMIARGMVQRCVSCGNNSCLAGEKCGYDRSQGGFFSATAVSSAKAVLPYRSSNAKAQSGKAFGTELEHVIPGAALRQMGLGANYGNEYTVPLPKAVHRGGVSGAGGGISSTGSSSTSVGWAQHLAQQPTTYGVVEAALTDGINAMVMQNAFTESMAVQYSDWLTAQCDQEGRITQSEMVALRNTLIERYQDQR